MANKDMVYGGYVNFPLAPKDVKGVQKLVDQYTTFEDMFSLLNNLAEGGFGQKIEHNLKDGIWKVVAYNLMPVKEGDNHTYYISGESDTLIKALCVVRYKVDAMLAANLSEWVKDTPKVEFR